MATQTVEGSSRFGPRRTISDRFLRISRNLSHYHSRS